MFNQALIQVSLEVFCRGDKVCNQLPLSQENVLNNLGGLGSIEKP